jgi:tetratricopeptide (TPR) repeat protein
VEDAAGKVVFSRTYDQRAAAAAATPSTAIRDIVTGLRVPLTSADELRLDNAPACRPDTYIEIARGRTFLAREDVEGNPARAESVFRAAASRDPSCAQAYAGLADASWARYGVEHRAELSVAASAASTTAKTLDPESPTIRMALARVYLNTGRAPQAEQLIREVIDRRPADDEPHRLLSSILDAQKRGEEAEAELHRAITLRPASAINHLALGNRQYRTLHYREALASYQKVLDVQPDNEWATGNCFAAHIMLGNFQQAIDVYQAARVKDATMQSNLGSVYVWLNRCDEAVAILRGAVDDAPRDDVKRRNLGDAYACLGRRAEALREYKMALSITRDLLTVNSENARDLARHAVYEAKCGSLALAAEHAEEAVRRSPSDGEVLYRAAVVHALSKQPARAVERLRQAIDKGYPPALARADPDLRAIERVAGVSEMLGGR